MQAYIREELLVLIPVLYFVGVGLRKSKIRNKRIPLVLGGLSIILSTLWVIGTSEISGINDWATALFSAVTQGILCAGASVYADQLYKQSQKKE